VAAAQGEVQAGPHADVQPREGPANELQVAAALDHPALIVTRPIEWGTVILGYEQANRCAFCFSSYVLIGTGHVVLHPMHMWGLTCTAGNSIFVNRS
jgi:hypothetical protein